MKRIGLEPGKPFDLAQADPAVRAGLERVPKDGLKAIRAKYSSLAKVVNGWQMRTDLRAGQRARNENKMQ